MPPIRCVAFRSISHLLVRSVSVPTRDGAAPAKMEDTTSGLCNVNSSIVYRDGVLDRCTYDFGHDGEHSWELAVPKHSHTHGHYRGAWTEPLPSRTDRDDGKLSAEEAKMLIDNEDES